ncbi:MAG: transposase [Planctomycetota bacterium]
MAKLVGYMVTWTTYGSWLQGDRRGYVRNGQILQGDETILQWCKKFQKGPTIQLNKQEKEIVRQSICQEAGRIGQKLEALAVCTNHVHLAVRLSGESIERTVSRYKCVATLALRHNGRSGRIWTTGFDKRFCFAETELARRIAYVRSHKD